MRDYIVLLKQVPDISQIADNVFNPETGTLIRSKLANVINDLDAQALAFAYQMRHRDPASGGRLIALSMGPPTAEEVLRYGLSRCVDTAILLTDRALSGADTVATAGPLGAAIRKIVQELLGGSQNYYVVCGMQSVDGDTAQVPGQLAEELGIGCVSNITDFQYSEKSFEFTRIISGGTQRVVPCRVPVVITVASYKYTLFATLAGARRAQAADVIMWGANDINAAQIGGRGSKTQVIRIFPPGKTSRLCRRVESVSELAQAIVDSYKSSATTGKTAAAARPYTLPGKRLSNFDRSFEALEKDIHLFEILKEKLSSLGIGDLYDLNDEMRERLYLSLTNAIGRKQLDEMLHGMTLFSPSFNGEVWVIAESDRGYPIPPTFELLGKARELADSLDTQVGVVVVDREAASASSDLISGGADKVYLIDHQLLEEFDPLLYRKAISDLIGQHWPQIVLFSATPQGRTLAPMVSYRLGCGLTADCTSLEIRDRSRRGEIAVLLQTRPALGGNVMATICTVGSRSQMATVRPGIMKRLPQDPSRQGDLIQSKVELNEEQRCMRIIATDRGAGTVNLDAPVVVSGGRGLQSQDNYEVFLVQLCSALSTTLEAKVEKGASRSAVEQGFTERVRQVGQTGTAIGPKLYLALGISGAIQHMIGVANSETIIAINKDPHAPIFKQCDYYYIADIQTTVPELIKALEEYQR